MIRLEIITNPDEILALEVDRVKFYIENLTRYILAGYASILRFPAGVDPTSPPSDEELKTIILKEFEKDRQDYLSFGETYREAWQEVQEKVIPVAEKLFGYELSGNIRLCPTAYGTVGGSYNSDNTYYYRLNKYFPDFTGKLSTNRSRSPIEILVHEIICHEGTTPTRVNSLIDETTGMNPDYQKYKERLMDLLGRTILVRSGLMEREKIAMQNATQQIASPLIDPIYYGTDNPAQQDENNLWWEGNLKALVDKIDEKLRFLPSQE